MLLTDARGAAAACEISVVGAAAIAEALKVNKTVVALVLGGSCRVARGQVEWCGGRRAAHGRGARRQGTRSATRAWRLLRRR